MNNKKYNVFLLLSNFGRNIISIFSMIILYKANISIQDIFRFLSIYYFISIIVNIISINFIVKYNYKLLLVISSVMLGISFSLMSLIKLNNYNLILIAIILSIANYTYHSVRHYLGIKYIDSKREVSISLIFMYFGTIVSSYVGAYITDKYSIMITSIIVIILSVISIIPLLFMNDKIDDQKINYKNIKFNNILFIVLEQFKVIFLLLEPLYLYIFIDKELKYVGVFNIFVGISSIIFIYFIGRKKNTKILFKYINILFTIILIFKLNIKNKILLLIIGFLEGFGIKNFEISSIENFYKVDKDVNIGAYLLISEIIFCLVSLIITLIFSLINNLIICMYICIFFIFICSFIRYKK